MHGLSLRKLPLLLDPCSSTRIVRNSSVCRYVTCEVACSTSTQVKVLYTGPYSSSCKFDGLREFRLLYRVRMSTSAEVRSLYTGPLFSPLMRKRELISQTATPTCTNSNPTPYFRLLRASCSVTDRTFGPRAPADKTPKSICRRPKKRCC